MENKKQKTSIGLDRNTTAALCYAGAWITGIVFFLLERKDKFVRFHALQSIFTFGGLSILMMLPVIDWVLSPLLMIAGFILWLVCIVKAYQGEEFMLPIVGPLAKKNVNKQIKGI